MTSEPFPDGENCVFYPWNKCGNVSKVAGEETHRIC